MTRASRVLVSVVVAACVGSQPFSGTNSPRSAGHRVRPQGVASSPRAMCAIMSDEREGIRPALTDKLITQYWVMR